MSIIKRNLAANFAGTVVTALLGLAVVPIYLRVLGPEAYGLVGFYAALQALFAVFDFGLGTVANREAARLSASDDKAAEVQTLVRTLEVFYGAAAVMIAAIVVAGAPLMAEWLNPAALPQTVVRNAIIVMGIAIALHFPIGLYSGILLGLQRHGVLNRWIIAGAILRLVAPFAVFVLLGPTIGVYFGWQALAAAAVAIGMRGAALRAVPHVERRAIDFGILRRFHVFATRVTGITILSAVVLQADKLAVSRFSALGDFGYYAAAATLAGGVLLISGPVAAAVFPAFSQMVAAGDLESATTLYHRASQFVAALLMPVAAVGALFPDELLIAWTRDANVAARAGTPLAFLIVALAANAAAAVPYVLQLAFGWTSLALRLNIAGAIVLVPSTIIAAQRAGAPGAAAVVCAWHVLALAVAAAVMHGRLLRHTVWSWVGRDLAPPLFASVIIAGGFRILLRAPGTVTLAAVAIVTLLASVAATPLTWFWLRERWSAR